MTDEINFRNALTEVKRAHNIVDYMRAAGIDFKTAGVDKWRAVCPFHNEKTPSFFVSESFQNYRCWGCGVNGDIISFAVEYENLSFHEAVTKLAEEKNIILNLGDDSNGIDYKSLHKVLRSAANFYFVKFNKLSDDHAAKEEIRKRGLTLNSDKIHYGYSPSGNALYKHLKKEGFSDDLLVESGLCRKSDRGDLYDFFRSRLMFIFTDRYGKPIGFSSRKLFEDDTRGKYVNSSENPLFHKSRVLYNHSSARKSSGKAKKLYIVEGQFDVAALVEAGVSYVVATSGTALTKEHVSECKKMVGNDGKLIFCFDGDEAGKKAALGIFTSFPEAHDVAYIVPFPDEADPCDYRLNNGNEALLKLLEKPMTLVEFTILTSKEKFDLSSVVGRARYVDEAAGIVKSVTNLTLRDQCIRLLSLESLTPVNVVREAVEKAKPLSLEKMSNFDKVREEVEIEEIADGEVEKSSLRALVKADEIHDIAARFIHLGLMRPAWRPSLIRSKDVIPKSFHPFLMSLSDVSDEPMLFPEMFDDINSAKYLMEEEFSPFYRFMEIDELKERFVYLHSLLNDKKERRNRARVQSRLLELLSSDDSGSLEYFKQLLEKEEEHFQDAPH